MNEDLRKKLCHTRELAEKLMGWIWDILLFDILPSIKFWMLNDLTDFNITWKIYVFHVQFALKSKTQNCKNLSITLKFKR